MGFTLCCVEGVTARLTCHRTLHRIPLLRRYPNNQWLASWLTAGGGRTESGAVNPSRP